ncbi:MAG: peptide chain release factor N(5)-glutamine methyltransferase, partial [Solirubrobacterales bacterium]
MAKATSPLRDALTEAAQTLEAAGVDTPRLDAEVMLAAALGTDRAALYSEPERSIEP